VVSEASRGTASMGADLAPGRTRIGAESTAISWGIQS